MMNLRWLAVALCVVSMGISLCAFGLASNWRVNFGDVGTWLSGIGSFAAAVVALKIAGDEGRRYEREKRESQRQALDRAVRRAKRVKIVVGDHPGGFTDTHVVALKNDGNSPIYDVTWYRPVILARRSDTVTQVFRNVEMSSQQGEAPKTRVMNPGDETHDQFRHKRVLAWFQPGGEAPEYAPTFAFPVMTFEDEDGNKLGIVPDEGSADLSTATSVDEESPWDFRWVLVDDDYPQSVGGLLGDLLKQAND